MRETEKHLFFWGGFLSQWQLCEFIIKEITFNCVEQYFMWQKAKTFGDEEIARMILEAEHPKVQKKLGRSVHGFNQEKWDELKQGIALIGNWAKFSHNEELGIQLLGTGGKELVEASPYDKIWGIGMPIDDPAINDPANWQGLNLLGRTLMITRTLLQISDKSDDIMRAYIEYKKLPKAELSGPDRDALIYRNQWCTRTGRSMVHPHPHRHFNYKEFKQRMQSDKLMQSYFKVRI